MNTFLRLLRHLVMIAGVWLVALPAAHWTFLMSTIRWNP